MRYSGQSGLQYRAAPLLLLTALVFVALFVFLPFDLVVALLIGGLVVFLYFGLALALTRYEDRTPDWIDTAPLWLVFVGLGIVGAVLLSVFWNDVTLFGIVFLLGMMFIFLYYWLLVPVALVQKLDQQAWERTKPPVEWPPITVLIPAYKERGYLSRTLDSLAASVYPAAVEIVVIDDGSLDGTYEEARDHMGTDPVVVQKENGGKHSALNRGLEEASHEIIVSVDADSWITPDALTKVVEAFQKHPDAGAIAGNVKVGNRESFLTRIQALEYVVGINTFRRAFDHVGLVSVVPGCLGAFRRRTLEEVEGYSSDTLTEDFDLTIEILKRGQPVHMSEGVVYTHAPTTWRGLYRQRLRWFRGHVQTIRKHSDVLRGAGYGLLRRLVFPYAMLSMSLFPLLGVAVVGIIVVLLTLGEVVLLLQLAAFFMALVVVLSLLAIEIDEEDRWLAIYSPLSVVGYKQFMDLILLKSVIDVFSGRQLRWTSAGRIPPSDPVLATGQTTEHRRGARFELYNDGNGWQWQLRDRHRRTVVQSCTRASSKEKAEQAVDVLRKHARRVVDGDEELTTTATLPKFEVSTDERGSWQWRLRRSSGVAIAVSGRGYSSEMRARSALARAQKEVISAPVTVLDGPREPLSPSPGAYTSQ